MSSLDKYNTEWLTFRGKRDCFSSIKGQKYIVNIQLEIPFDLVNDFKEKNYMSFGIPMGKIGKYVKYETRSSLMGKFEK